MPDGHTANDRASIFSGVARHLNQLLGYGADMVAWQLTGADRGQFDVCLSRHLRGVRRHPVTVGEQHVEVRQFGIYLARHFNSTPS